MADEIVLQSGALAKLVVQGEMALKAGQDYRKLQAQNAALAQYYDQPGIAGNPGAWGNPGPAITGAVVYTIQDQQILSATLQPSSMMIVFDSACGSGRYLMHGPAPTPTIGIQIPAGGFVLNISGADNIRKFQLIAESGQTLTFSRYMFL